MIYLETGSTNPFYNLAFEEYVLKERTEGDYLILWQNDNTIVIGQNQNAYAEINEDFVRAHGINVVRRTTGGGAVYHDMGNLNYSFITDVGDLESLSFKQFTEPVVEVLKKLGLNASSSGRNDIIIDDKKISGTAQRVSRSRVLHHGTLLFNSNPEMVAGALNVDPEKFRSKGAKSVRARIGNIYEMLPEKMSLDRFWDYLREEFAGRDAGIETLKASELLAVEALKKEKYDRWEWNFGRSPKYDMVNKRYFDGGMLEVHMQVASGVIEDIIFYGDFMATKSMEDVTAGLIGCPNKYEDIKKILSGFDIKSYFGTIDIEEIISLMTGA